MGFFGNLNKGAELVPTPAPVVEAAVATVPVMQDSVQGVMEAPKPRATRRPKAEVSELPLLAEPRLVKPGVGPVIHENLLQGTDEWLAARCGMLTASEMKLIVTPTFKAASNEKERAHLYELLAQRITKFVEPTFVSADTERGLEDEDEVLGIYAKHFAQVDRVGFITNDKWGFTLGYSPDGLVGTEGQVEIKSRRQKFQVETFVISVSEDAIPADFLIQVQTGLLVSERLWCDFLSYSGGLPLARIRAYPDEVIQGAILDAAEAFERRLAKAHDDFHAAVATSKAIPTKRRPLDIHL